MLEHDPILPFNAIYNALGCKNQSFLAETLNAATDEDNAIVIDKHCRTSVSRLYAAGDLCSGLNQIAVALGHGAIVATTIHNDLKCG